MKSQVLSMWKSLPLLKYRELRLYTHIRTPKRRIELEKMRAILKKSPGPGADIEEVTTPKPGQGEVLIKIIASSICGTDVHIYEWDQWASSRIRTPRIFGHEFIGEVVEVGEGVSSIKPGDYVSAETHIACGKCYLCRTGNAHLCQNVKILGVDTDGAFADYIAIPEENAWLTDRTIPPEIASIQEPLGNAVHATLIEDVAGKTVAIFGCGPIGLFSVKVAKVSGASKVFAVEPNEMRLKLAGKLGADHLINPKEVDPVEYILDNTGGLGVDVFLEMSGNSKGIVDGFKALRKGGRASLLGIFPGSLDFDFNDLVVFKGAKIYGINGRIMFKTWYTVKELLEREDFDLSPVITHKMKMGEIHKAMDLLVKKEAAKIVLYPEWD